MGHVKHTTEIHQRQISLRTASCIALQQSLCIANNSVDAECKKMSSLPRLRSISRDTWHRSHAAQHHVVRKSETPAGCSRAHIVKPHRIQVKIACHADSKLSSITHIAVDVVRKCGAKAGCRRADIIKTERIEQALDENCLPCRQQIQ